MEKHIEKLKQKYVEELICNAIQTGKLVLNCQGNQLEKSLKNIQNNFDIFKISCIFVYRISSSAKT